MKICRTCLQVLNNDAKCVSLNIDDCSFDYPSVRSKLLVCVPELAVDLVECAIICASCCEALNTAYNFKNKCLRTDEMILNYTQLTGRSADSVNISEVVQFNIPNCNPAENKLELADVHYPITQIIEQDSEVDIKPVILKSEASSDSSINQSYVHDLEVDIASIKTEMDVLDSSNTDVPKLLTPIPFNPELDVEVRGFKINSSNVCQQYVAIYNGENPHECAYCHVVFPRESDLEAHLATHTEMRPFQCTICERRFVRKDKLMLHMRIHTGEKPFECTLCGRCFSRKDKLNNHMRTHTREKPHQCILCQKCFARKDKMNTHMRSQHWLALANLEITVVKNAANTAEPSVPEGTTSQ